MERFEALKILGAVLSNGKYSNLELNKRLKANDFPPQKKALITGIVYGVLQNKIRIDYVISAYTGNKKLDDDVKNILRIGVYQILFTDKIPDYAIVNESLKLVEKCRKKSAKGLVNAVLRGIIRGDKEIKYKEEDFLSVYYSVPKEICDMLISDFGKDGENMIKCANGKPPFTARINTLKISEKEFEALSGEKAENGVVCFETGRDVTADELYKKGYYYPQDVNSMLPPVWLSPKKGETVIDMCAAPGGKTTHIAQLMENEGKIYAFDIYEHKLELIEKTAKRLGISIIEPVLCDAAQTDDRFIGVADKILCDVPCSGFGILRRKPEIRYTHSIKASRELCKIQYDILSVAAKYLKKGGTLVYSTCTVAKCENEDNVRKFLDNNKNFSLKRQKQLFIEEGGGDGFFVAEMIKNEE